MTDGLQSRVRLRVISRMRDADGTPLETKNAHRGTLVRTDGAIELAYDEERDGEKARITLTLQAGPAPRDNRASMRRRGMTRGELRFVPGRCEPGSYVTPYGEIPVAVDTRRVDIEQTETGGVLTLDYDVYMGGERSASALLEVTWRC